MRAPAARGGLLAAITLAVVTVVTFTLVVAVRAQPAEDAEPEIRIVVTSLSTALGPGVPAGGPADISLRVFVENTGAVDVRGMRIAVEVFDAVGTRSELHFALDEQQPQTRLRAAEIIEVAGGARIAPGSIVSEDIDVPEESIRWTGSGVHPVRISVLEGRDVLTETTTAVVHLDSEPEVPLPVVLGWPLGARPAVDEASWEGLAAAAAQGGRLERLVRSLEHHAGTAVQPLLGAHLLEDLDSLAAAGDTEAGELRARMTAELQRRGVPPVAAPYADADLTGLVAHGLELEALRHVVEGPRRLEENLDMPVALDALWAVGGISPAAVRDLLIPARIRTLVLGWEDVSSSGSLPDHTPAGIRPLAVGGGSVAALVPDPWLESLLAEPDTSAGPLIAAQRIVAETALVHLERPFADHRLLVLLPPSRWDPPASVTDHLLATLGRAPWVTPTSVTDASVLRVADSEALRVRSNTVFDAGLAAEIRSVRHQLSLLEDALATPPVELLGRSWSDLDDAILRSASRLRTSGDRQRAVGLLGDVRQAIAAGLGTVTLPEGSQVTLTDAEGTVPVTISRPDGPALRVRVELRAPPRLDFPDGTTREMVLEEGSRQTISFRTVAHGTGNIPVTVRVLAASAGDTGDAVLLAEETVVVRSMAVSRPALGGLGAILGVLLALSLLRRRRPKRPDLIVVQDQAA